MAEYVVEIPGQHTLEQIERAIQGEEAVAARFLRTSVSYYDNRITNLATFEELPPGQRPEGRVVLVKHGTAPPAGKQSIWAGVMLVAGSNEAVRAYR